MKLALAILITIHGIIHLFGFLKAFGISEFHTISEPIVKNYGLLWLMTFLLFSIAAILILVHSDYWWLSSSLAVVISQALILHYWSDAKFGTIANIIILFATIIAYSSHSFRHKIKEERAELFESLQYQNKEIISEETLLTLPPTVQKWMTNCGVIGKRPIINVYITQELQLKLNSEQINWNKGVAQQYFTIQPPAFNWNINTEMKSVLSVAGKDKFEDGKGEMLIKLFSLIPIVNEKNNEKINQATLQRYLAEIVWFPSASLNEYIKWEQLDAYSARAIMEFKGTKGSGIFHFDDKGNFKKFVAMRYQGSNDPKPTEWTVIATKTAERNGIKVPLECEASWELENGKWTWLKLRITDIQYNVKEMPVDDNG